MTILPKASTAGRSSSEQRYGLPSSPAMTTRGSIGTRPRNGRSNSLATCSPPPVLNISTVSPQWGQTKPDMFSTTPTMSTLTVLQKLIDFLTSASATFCGVVTTMALSSGMVWATDSGSSPVPGGASITR